jgi:hypothetical protein
LLGLLSPAKRQSDLISRVTFNAALKPQLEVFSNFSASEIFSVIGPFVTAFLNGAKQKELPLKITNPVIFRALFILFPEIAQKVQDKFGKQYSTQNFETVMQPMFASIKPSVLKNPGNSAAAVAGHFLEALKSKFVV